MSRFGGSLGVRVASALVLAPIVIGAVWAGGLWFGVLIAFMAGIGLGEWQAMVKKPLPRSVFFMGIGLLYIGGGAASLLYLRDGAEPLGLAWLLYLLFVVWGTDTGAYFAGSLIGGPKLLPKISPKKTWSGLGGGILCASLCGAGVAAFFGASSVVGAGLLAAILAVVAQAGDFFESYIKRRANVKDSGSLIPGHGGVLDRVDGLLTAALVLAACRLAGWSLLG